MLCKKPISLHGMVFGCGQCLPCRVKRRKIWAHRIMLESVLHSANSFLTLTYSDEYLPRMFMSEFSEPVLTLAPVHLKNFLKRLRRKVEPLKLRFFGVGEYGDVSWRPHYHVIVFGLPGCQRGMTKVNPLTREPEWAICCDNCRLIGKSWGKGHIFVGEVNKDTAEYVAKYAVKKMTMKDDPRLEGRNPEFSRMSNRRGIGFDALWDISDVLMRYGLDKEDVPSALCHGKKHFLLGRYLQGKLRGMCGKDETAPQELLERIQEEMRPVWLSSIEASESVAKALVRHSAGELANFDAKQALWVKRRSI